MQRVSRSICLQNGPGVSQPANSPGYPDQDVWIRFIGECNACLLQKRLIQYIWLEMNFLNSSCVEELYNILGNMPRLLDTSTNGSQLSGEAGD